MTDEEAKSWIGAHSDGWGEDRYGIKYALIGARRVERMSWQELAKALGAKNDE